MGNTQSETADIDGKQKKLNLSKQLSPKEYLMHEAGTFIESSLHTIPVDLIHHNEITMFEEVDLSFNSIEFIPEELSLRLPHLRHFNISHNQLTVLPKSFQYLLHLQNLDLSYNKLEVFPEPVLQLNLLQSLNIAQNGILELPNKISMLENLQKLNVSHNRLRILPDCLIKCKKLYVIVCLGNNMIHPPQNVCDKSSKDILKYLAQTNVSLQKKPSLITPIFTRTRGQQSTVRVQNPHSANREYKQAQLSWSNKHKCPLMMPKNATSLSPEQFVDALLGLIYGACIGDALGLNGESLTQDECKFYYDDEPQLDSRIRDFLRSNFSDCDWSSNVDFMVLTLDSMMRWGGVIDELEIASEFLQWMQHGSEFDPTTGYVLSPLVKRVISADGYAASPHTTCERIHNKLKAHQSDTDINLHDNACLPLALAIAIPNFYKLNEVSMNAERVCKATHASHLCVAASVFVSIFVAFILQGKFESKESNITELLKEIKAIALSYFPTFLEDLAIFEDIFEKKTEALSSLKSNDVMFTIKFLFNAFSHKDNFVQNLYDQKDGTVDYSKNFTVSQRSSLNLQESYSEFQENSVNAQPNSVDLQNKNFIPQQNSLNLQNQEKFLNSKSKSFFIEKTSFNFKKCLKEVLNVGQEGLSAHACVVGGVLGAYFGFSKLPHEWLEQLPRNHRQILNSKLNHLIDLFGLP